MLTTDAQVHLYESDTPANPWPRDPDRTSAPAKHANGFSAEEMLGAMEAIGVDRAVVVPPVWAGENNAPALAAAAKYAGRFAVMGRVDPYDPESPALLEHWREQPNMLGIRMSGKWPTSSKQVHEVFEDTAVEWYWEACERLHIPIMTLAGRYVARLGPIAQRHPNLKLIIDHLSAMGGDTVAASFGAYEDLIALAKNPQVYVKVGNGPNRSQQQFPFEDVHPYLRGIYDAFGPHRMLWEADITQLTKDTYADCLRLWQDGLPFLTASDKDWILGLSAAEALNWPEPTL